MDLPTDDLDRLVFFEHACKTAETEYSRNPQDAENLVRWGGALLELSQFQNGPDCIKMLQDSISKLEEALVINSKKHDALWYLGNAYTSQGFLSIDHEVAKMHFGQASDCFQRAVDEDPGNELYLKSLEMASKAPDLHLKLQSQVISQQASTAAAASSTSTTKVSNKEKSSDFKYDVCGWIILAIGIVAWVGMAKSQVQPPPPR